MLTKFQITQITIISKQLFQQTSNTDAPVKRLRAANSKIKVPAQAVHVSVSVPVRASGLLRPNFKLTYGGERAANFTITMRMFGVNLLSKASENQTCS